MLDDRDEAIRALACAQLAQRIVAGMPGASLEPLTRALIGGRRELLLAAAEGLAKQQRPEAFQPLLLARSRQARRWSANAPSPRWASWETGVPGISGTLARSTADDRALAPDAAEALGALLPA
ncbi:MAG: hypothetical protein R3F40_10360 [Candidatus Competibacteraceae bacterium]